MYLESTPCFSPSTSSQSLYHWLTASCTCHIIFLHCFSTLIILHSFTPGSKPTSFTSSSHNTLLLPPQLYFLSKLVLFFSSFPYFFCFLVLCGIFNWLSVSFSVHVKDSHTVSYHFSAFAKHIISHHTAAVATTTITTTWLLLLRLLLHGYS